MSNSSPIAYHRINLSDLQIENKAAPEENPLYLVKDKSDRFDFLSINPRFWISLGRKSGFKKDFMEYFEPGEIIDRIIKTDGDQKIIVTQDSSADPTAYGICSQNDNFITYDKAREVLEKHSPVDISYSDGNLVASFEPKRGVTSTSIANEDYMNRFQVRVPIDGFKNPEVLPLLTRLACQNVLGPGASEFISKIIFGKNECGHTLDRSIEAYNMEKIQYVIAQKLENSKTSWASLLELHQFIEFVRKHGESVQHFSLIRDVINMIPSEQIEIIEKNKSKNIKYLKRRRSSINRYNLVQMATEISSHYYNDVGDEDKRLIEGYVGRLISNDPDCEGSAPEMKNEEVPNFFFKKEA